MDTVRYKPAEVARWLQTGAQEARSKAAKKGRSLAKDPREAGIPSSLKRAAGAVMDMGRGAFAELVHKQAEGTEYALDEDKLEARNLGRSKAISYRDVKQILAKSSDRYQLVLASGTHMVKPIAHLVAGRLKVPIGWRRNTMEVPYETLIDEIAARCGLEIQPG